MGREWKSCVVRVGMGVGRKKVVGRKKIPPALTPPPRTNHNPLENYDQPEISSLYRFIIDVTCSAGFGSREKEYWPGETQIQGNLCSSDCQSFNAPMCATIVVSSVARRVCGPVSIKHGLRTVDYGLGIKYRLGNKIRTEVYKTRTEV